MKNQWRRTLSLLLMLVMLLSLAVPSVSAEDAAVTEETVEEEATALTGGENEPSEASALFPTVRTPADESPYSSYAAIGDSISAGYGPLMGDNTWNHFYYDKPPVGAYPYELTKDLGLDLQDDFNSMLCVDQRLIDVYYSMGGDPDPVADPEDTSQTVEYLADARIYHSEAYMEVLEALHNSGEGAERIRNSDLITIMVGMADLSVYPIKRIGASASDSDKILELMKCGLDQYIEYYPRMIKLIQELNPDATICILSMYDPYAKFEASGLSDNAILAAYKTSISSLNTQLRLWASLYGCKYVDITGLGDYIDNDTTEVKDGQLLSHMMSHENHPGAAGHRYVEDQILDALSLERASVAPSTDGETSYLCFSSDIHNGDDGKSAARLSTWVDNVSSELGDITFDYMGICGDIGSAFVGSSAYGNKVQVVMDAISNNTNVKGGIYATGNHEFSPGRYATDSAYEPYASYTRLGEAADTDNYQVYCFGAAQYDQRYNQADIDAMADYLANEADNSKPVFILSHFPIHSNASRSTVNADKVISVLNNYPNVIFLWGHNHTDSDPHYGIIYSGDLEGTPINFIYGSAGCMSDSEYSSGSSNTTAKGLVAAMDGDEDLTLTYYDKDYEVVSAYAVNITDGTAEEIDPEGGDAQPNFDGKTYSEVESVSEGEYVIAVGKKALNCVPHAGYETLSNSYIYGYSGFAGGKVGIVSHTITSGLTQDEVWTFTKASGGYTIQNHEGKYLTAFYTDTVGGGIRLEDTAETNAVWSYIGGNLKNVGTGKQLNYEIEADISGEKQSGETDLFTIRTNANDTIVLYSASETTKEVISDYEAVSSFTDGSWYLITAESFALLGTAHDGYVTDNGALYKYTGLNGRKVTVQGEYVTSAVKDDMLWQAEKVSDGFALKNKDGKYLGSTYTAEGDYTGIGQLYVSDTAEAWTLSGTALRSVNSSKYLNYQNPDEVDGTLQSGKMNFFTVRSSSKDEVKVYLSAIGDGHRADPDEVIDTVFDEVGELLTPEYNLITGNTLTDGAQLVVSYKQYYMGTGANDGFKLNNSNYYFYSGLNADSLGIEVGKGTAKLPYTTEAEVWTVKTADGGYYLMQNGKYLSGNYVSGDFPVTEGGQNKTVSGKLGTVTLVDEPDAYCIWVFSNDGGSAKLQNKGCSKYLTYNFSSDVGDTCLYPASKSSVSLFTVRSSASHSLYLYQKVTVKHKLVTSTRLQNGGKVVLASDRFYMGTNRNDGFKLNNGAYYQYTGLNAVEGLGAVASTSLKTLPNVTTGMQWTVEKTDNGYMFKNAVGYYLSGSYDSSGSYIDVTEEGEDISVSATGIGRLTLLKKADESCVWTISENSSGKATLKNAKCGKVLAYNNGSNVDDVCLYPASKDDVSLFTVRSSNSNGIYIYQETRCVMPEIESGERYVMINDEGYALSSKAGKGYNDVNSDYRYDGLTPVAVEMEDGKIASAITNDLVWTLTKSGDGYTVQNSNGQYMNSVYDTSTGIKVFFSDSPEVWTIDGGYLISQTSKKYLTRQTNAGTASVFTLRSGEKDAQPFKFYGLSEATTVTALYVTSTGGVVSNSREVFNKGDELDFRGATAKAKSGYDFLGWYQGESCLSTEAHYVPSGGGVYEARFREQVAVMKYQIRLKGTGDPAPLSLTTYEEAVGAATGAARGSTAKETEGYTFLYWTSDEAGTRIINRNATYVPRKTAALAVSGTYYAWYEKEVVCYGTETRELSGAQSGTHYLYVNGKDCGKFVFSEVDGGYSIYSPDQKKFVSVDSDKNLYYSSVYATWSYSKKGFSTSVPVKVLFFNVNRTYYITLSGDAMAASTSAPSSVTLVDKTTVGYTEHMIGSVVSVDDETHSGICSRCGAAVTTEPHSYTYADNGDGTHTGTCTCGKKVTHSHDLGYTSVDGKTHSAKCSLCSYTAVEDHHISFTTTATTHKGECSDCGFTVTEAPHSYTYECNGNGTHTCTCTVCDYETVSNCEYDGGVCKYCGGLDPNNAKVTGVKVSISSEKVYANLLKRLFGKYTMQYTVTITPETQSVTVKSVSHSSSRTGTYESGSSFTSTAEVTDFWIKVVDSNNAETLWHYTNGSAAPVI